MGGTDLIKIILKPFIEVTQECFETMMNLKLSVKEIRYAEHQYRGEGVYAVIGFTGDMQGMISISFSTSAARVIIGRFMDEEIAHIDETAIDAVGEIINIIAGGKSQIKGHSLVMSLPSVISGTPMLIALPRDVPVISTTFTNPEFGEFSLYVCLKES